MSEMFEVHADPSVDAEVVEMIEKLGNDPEYVRKVIHVASCLNAGLPVTLPDGRVLTR